MAPSFYSQRNFSYRHSLGIWAQVFMTSLMLTILSIKASYTSPSRVVYISKSKGKKNLHPRTMKWIITNRNHGGYERSQGRENVGKLLSLSVSQISVGPPWGCKETSSCLGKGNSHHSPSYANRFNVSTSYPRGYFSTLVCLVQKCVSSSHTFLCVRCLVYGLISVRPRKKRHHPPHTRYISTWC